MEENKETQKDINFNNQPIVETKMSVSKDGNWFIHKTIITDIKPMTYMDAVFKDKQLLAEKQVSKIATKGKA